MIFSQIICLMYYCQDIVTVLANMYNFIQVTYYNFNVTLLRLAADREKQAGKNGNR